MMTNVAAGCPLGEKKVRGRRAPDRRCGWTDDLSCPESVVGAGG